MPDFRSLSTDDLISRLRKAASIWFKNDDLLLLEELIRRVGKPRSELDLVNK